MRKQIVLLAAVSISLLLMILSGCNLPGIAHGAQSPEQVYTSAAQTVAVELTNQATHFPTTSTPPAQPTLPSIQTAPPPAATLPAVSTLPPQSAPSATQPLVADKANFVSQDPTDGAQISAGANFKTVWTLKNVGKTTWSTKYFLRPFIAQSFGGPAQVFLPSSVKPDDQVSIEVPMVAPTSLGEAKTIWVLTNDQGANFYPLYLTIKVVNKPTATPTPTRDLTATAQYCDANPDTCPTKTP
jgi:hypothetical protein